MKHVVLAAIAAAFGLCGLAWAVEPPAPEQTEAAIAAPGAPSGWRALITPEDKTRLDNLWDARNGAIKEAEAAILAKEPNALAAASATNDVLNTDPTLVRDADVIGNYRCRVTKLGGQYLQLVQYKYFTCRIFPGPENSLTVQKTSGSQRFIGRLWLDETETSYVYLGSSYVNSEQPWAYNEKPSENQVGRLYRLGPNRLRLELPKPHYESNFDVLEFVRIR